MNKFFFNPDVPCTNLVELLRWRAAGDPDRSGFTFLQDGAEEEVRCSYAELDRRARSIAAWLQTKQARGERALLLFPPGLDYLAGFFGCLYAGVIAVPAFPPRPNRPMPRLQGIIDDAQVKIALTSSSIVENIRRNFSRAPRLQALSWLNLDELPGGLESVWSDPEVAADDLAFLQYTSGSTSSPRGVMLTHRNLMHNLSAIHGCFELHRDCGSVFWLPPYHDMGLIGGILEPLYSGSQVVLMSPAAFLQSPFRWLEAISRTRAVVSGAPNFAYDLCLSKITAEQRSLLDLSSWTLAFNGAEPIRPETMERFAEAFEPCGFRREAFYPCYGLAESSLFVTGGPRWDCPVTCVVDAEALQENRVQEAPLHQAKSRVLVSSGRSPAGQKILIVHPQRHHCCPAGEVGEIWMQSPSVARGYWNRGEESRPIFTAKLASGGGPFLRTGDLGFLHDGELFVTGRAKDLIILHGKNFYPQDIEQTVEESHPAVRRSCVAAFSVEADGQERLVVVAEVERASQRQNQEKTLSAIRQAIVAHHDIAPRSLVLIKTLSLPKTSSGKIQRQACKEQFLNRTLEVLAEWTEPTAPASAPAAGERRAFPNRSLGTREPGPVAESRAIQDWLLAQIAARLQVPAEQVDPCMPFASLGMDSLTALMLAGDLEVWLGRPLSPTLMYDHPSIEALAWHLAGDRAANSCETRAEPDNHQTTELRALRIEVAS